MAKPTNSSAKNMWMIITRPVKKRLPPVDEKASERLAWARRRWRFDAVSAPTL
jgi:hypothetical protein